MKAVAYCRVSTDAQSEGGVSLDMQQDRISAWCAANGYELEAIFIEVMSGGRSANRPELLKALSLACKVQGVLVVYSLSRLARSVRDTLMIAERLEKAGANLASLTERIDTNSALGKMVFRLLSTLNEFEKDQLSERTENAMAHMRRSNRRISAWIPMGYNLAADGETLIANPCELRVVEEICLRRRQGQSLKTIAQAMHQQGFATKTGKRWFGSTVRAILQRHQKLAAA